MKHTTTISRVIADDVGRWHEYWADFESIENNWPQLGADIDDRPATRIGWAALVMRPRTRSANDIVASVR